MKFIGRDAELKKLNQLIRTDSLSTGLIYGRRRVGKSELVKHVLNNTSVPSIYYECKQVTESSNTEALCDIVSEVFDLPKLGFQKIEEILDYVFSLGEKKKIILVLDEYPYLKSNVKGMDSIIQSLIDKYKDTSRIKFIILGSFIDVMKSILEHNNPMYGRVDLIINLTQMDYYESSQFYPRFNEEDKVRIYSVFGGIPYYNRLVDDSLTVRENIIDLIASDGARLENEISMFLSSEISKIVNANEVIDALSRGYSKYSDILAQSHVSSGPTMIDVLDKLIRMEIVEKVAPINDENNKKKAGYYIADNLSMFYYRYIFRHLSQLRIMDSEIFYDKYIEEDFEAYYVPHQFESISKQYLIRMNKQGKMNPVVEKIGKYYYDDPVTRTNGEFDLVTQDECGYVFYEVKFRKKPLSKSMVEKEISQVQATHLDCYKYVFITRNGAEELHDSRVKIVELSELYSD